MSRKFFVIFFSGGENRDINRETDCPAVFYLRGQRIHRDLGRREQGLSEEVEEAVSTEVQVLRAIEETGEGRGG